MFKDFHIKFSIGNFQAFLLHPAASHISYTAGETLKIVKFIKK